MICAIGFRPLWSWWPGATKRLLWIFWMLPSDGWMSKKKSAGCRPPVLDAVFSTYFAQAKSQNIWVDAKIALPDTLPVDEGELAIVVANALENAIHSHQKLPQNQKGNLLQNGRHSLRDVGNFQSMLRQRLF